MNKQQKFGIGLFILCVLIWFFIIPSQVKGGGKALIFPRFVTAWLAFFSLALLFKKQKIAKKEDIEKIPSNSNKKGYWRVITTFIITLLYINLITILGFFISSFLFLVLLMWTLKVRNWIKLFIYPIIVLFLLYIFIEKILLFPLPDGLLF